MIYTYLPLAVVVFLFFVGIVLGLSFYFGRKTKSESGYYAAGGRIHWAVNGIAFFIFGLYGTLCATWPAMPR